MVQTFEWIKCTYCRRKTDECCDWCAFLKKVANPICARHRFTRSPWNGELHTLCTEHERQLHAIRQAYARDHTLATHKQFIWRSTQAYEYEPYLKPERQA